MPTNYAAQLSIRSITRFQQPPRPSRILGWAALFNATCLQVHALQRVPPPPQHATMKSPARFTRKQCSKSPSPITPSKNSMPPLLSPKQVAAAIGPRLAKDAIGAVSTANSATSPPPSRKTPPSPSSPPSRGPQRPLPPRHSTAHVMAEAIHRLSPRPCSPTARRSNTASTTTWPSTSRAHRQRLPEDRSRDGEDRRRRPPLHPLRTPARRRHGQASSKEGNKYKIDNAQRALAADANAVISWYATGKPGQNWEDLCRGPHVPSTGRIKALQAHVRRRRLLARRRTKRTAPAHLRHRLLRQETTRRPHQAARRSQEARPPRPRPGSSGLFTIDDAVGQGLVLWKPKGAIVRQELQNFIRRSTSPSAGLLRRSSPRTSAGSASTKPPAIIPTTAKPSSPRSSQIRTRQEAATAPLTRMKGDEGYLLKPMNCPHHIKIFAAEPRSYRDLPVRLAEFGTVYRWEKSGELGGMTRVRGFTQDDAHLFCTEEQVARRVPRHLELVKIVLGTPGLERLPRPRRPARPRLPQVRRRPPATTGTAPKTTSATSLDEIGRALHEEARRGRLLRPQDRLRRQGRASAASGSSAPCRSTTILPERFDLEYIGADNQPHRPVMIHRAPFGCMERFIGVLIEHFAGSSLPLYPGRHLPISRISTSTKNLFQFKRPRATSAPSWIRRTSSNRGYKSDAADKSYP